MCSSDRNVALKAKSLCKRMPWMMRLEDHLIPDNQLGAAYQKTRIDHEMLLNVNSDPKIARLTGIMVTLGEKNSHPMGITDIVLSGADMVRMNMSHKEPKWHAISVQSIREAGNRIHRCRREVFPLAVAMDLRGPEIRTGLFNGAEDSMGYAEFKEGNSVKLLVEDNMKRTGCDKCFWVSYPDLPRFCKVGDKIYIDRGAVILETTCVAECTVTCKVVKGGIVRNEKLVQLVDGIPELPQVSGKDDADIGLALDFECDLLIVSHVRNGQMICAVKDRIKQIGTRPICVVAKISCNQGLEAFDDILKVADAIMIDRAGIEVDIRPEKVFLAQKCIISKCNRVGKPVIIAVRIKGTEPSYTDMNDISCAVLDGVDSIFLATGALSVDETVKVVKNVDIACREAECARWQRQTFEELSYKALIPLDPTHSIAVAAIETSMKCNAAAIIVTTTTGRSAMMLSIYRPRCPIIAVTRYGIVARWLQVYFAVHPIHYRNPPYPDWSKDMDYRIQHAMNYSRSHKFVEVGNAVVIVSGWRQGSGFTNCIRIVYASPGNIPNLSEDFEESW
ncbi:pyruvate kinase PKM-like [Diprion similis]|uniref:pyruvate kinase PKM-like n=1 Tax=Diprion similis TaxID=362088 RepID=UPI001EF77177|nr:pyruvate kinase PKM-like [Diprion similis]